jgi:hypothetical protein
MVRKKFLLISLTYFLLDIQEIVKLELKLVDACVNFTYLIPKVAV